MTFKELVEKKGICLSDEQWEAVDSDTATVVTAGAGSGKTTVLALRFSRLVLEGKAHADEILTLTFSVKAASEMRERIYSLLSEASAEEELGEFLPEAQISTMDSFWADIARTDSLSYGVTRDFSILQDEQRESLLSLVLGQLENDPDWLILSSYFKQGEIRSRFSELADKAAFLLDYSAEENIASYKAIAQKYEAMRRKQAQEVLEVIQEQAGELLSRKAGESQRKMAQTVAKALDALSRSDYGSIPKVYIHGSMPEDVRAYVKREFNDSALLTDLKKLGKLSGNLEYVEAVSRLIGKALSLLAREKRAAGLLSFHDAEALAKAILIDNKNVRQWYKERYKYIMVDEFQDNNASQKELLYLLAERRERRGDGIPKAGELDPGKLFFVGDAKQSIYAFRGADVSVFRGLKADVEEMGGKLVSLTRNYRSEPGLIRHFNEVFANVFTPDQSEEDLREERLFEEVTGVQQVSFEAEYEKATEREGKGVRPVISLALLPLRDKEAPDTSLEMMDRGESEAMFLADKIQAMVSSDEYLISGKEGLRRPSYGDIAVLVRVNKSQIPIERIFRIRGIPYVVQESATLTVDGLASDFYAFLQLLLYPEDRFAYLTLLRSPFSRLSDEALLLMADPGKRGFHAFRENPPLLTEEDKESYRLLKELYESALSLAGRLPLTGLVSKLWHESGYQAWLAGNPSLNVFTEHYRYLWALAEKYDQSGQGLSSFLDFLRPRVGSSERLKQVSLQHFSSDSVQIMTIHGSKGLEFPIVIIPDSTRSESASSASFAMLQGRHPYMMFPLSKNEDPVNALFDGYAARRMKAERKRLLYVAVTRAEAHLLVTASEKARGNRGLLEYYLRDRAPVYEEIPGRLEPELWKSYREKEAPDYSFFAKPVYEPGRIESVRIGVRDYAEGDNSMLSGEILPTFPVDDLLSGYKAWTAFGVLAHEALEAAMGGFDPSFTKDRSLPDAVEETLEREASRIAGAFAQSAFYREYVEGRYTETEVRFYYPENGQVLEGVADLLVHEEDSITVIDYKTDRRKNPEQHRGQLESYVKALSDIYGKPCRAVLCYLRDFSGAAIV